mgnify:CR=1 FL=1
MAVCSRSVFIYYGLEIIGCRLGGFVLVEVDKWIFINLRMNSVFVEFLSLLFALGSIA